MHLYSKKSLTIVKISSPILSQFFITCFPRKNFFNISPISLGLSGKMLLESPEVKIAGDLINLKSDLAFVLSLPKSFFHQNTFL